MRFITKRSNDFYAMDFGFAKENHVAAVRDFSIPFSNGIDFCSALRRLRETTKSLEQYANVSVSLRLAPILQRMDSNLSHISVCGGRKPESSHLC